jgi:uncharacterized protein DUF5947
MNALQRYARRDRSAPAAQPEKCELCGGEIPSDHSHIVNLESRSLMCGCRACHLLFTRPGAARGKFKAVPRRHIYLPSFQLSLAQWYDLQIPVGIAFFFFNSILGRVVACYPSPAGPTESALPIEAWRDIARLNPAITAVADDVEAILVRNLRRDLGFECLIVPIDACYELTGRIRKSWKGFDGGPEAWREIDAFFSALRARCGDSTGGEEL